MMIKRLFIISLLVLIPSISFGAAGDPTRGKEIYDKRCWWCHGRDGAGDGPSAGFLNPPPRDFTMGVYKWKSTPFDEIAPGDDDFYRMIAGSRAHNSIPGWNGMSGTSMPGWSDMLNDNEVWDLTAFLKSLAKLEKPEKPPIDLSGQVKSSKDSIERGRQLFKDRCSECHGEEGRGDAIKKLKDDAGYRTWPRDLTKAWSFRTGNDPKDIYTRITAGIPGTQMPSFADPQSKKKLTDTERWDVANFVASLDAPYKKPGDDTVIKAVKVEGALPQKPDDSAWDRAEWRSFYMAPQILADERLFKPTLNSISVKALYNANDIAFLVEWDDPTHGIPDDAKSMEIADGEVYEDGVALQFPATLPKDSEKPYFGMGDSKPVNIWFWQSEGVGVPQRIRLINSKGYKEREERDAALSGLKAEAFYVKGTWRVVMKRALKGGEKDITFEEGKFVPVAFAAWDGSNQDRGSKHVMTGWYSLLLEPERNNNGFIWAVVAALIVFGLEILWLNSVKRKRD